MARECWNLQKENYDAKEYYVDGVGQIHFAGNMVPLRPVTSSQALTVVGPDSEPAFRVIMPPQGFLGAFNSMQQLIDKFVAAGVSKRK